MSAAAYAAGTALGGANSRRAAAFRALAPGFLGMDGRRGGVRVLLCSGFPNVAGWNAGKPPRVKYWEIIADNLGKAGWSWGCVSVVDLNGRTDSVEQTRWRGCRPRKSEKSQKSLISSLRKKDQARRRKRKTRFAGVR